MPGTSAEPFRDLNAKADWPFFEDDCSIPEQERSLIRPYSEAAAGKLWESYVSATPSEHHPMLLADSHWLQPTLPGPNWLVEHGLGFYRPDDSLRVQSYILERFALDPSTRVLFLLSKASTYSVPIGVFAQYWAEFLLLGDEGPFLFHPETKAFLCFGPGGQTAFGRQAVM